MPSQANVRFRATAVIGCVSSETARSRMPQARPPDRFPLSVPELPAHLWKGDLKSDPRENLIRLLGFLVGTSASQPSKHLRSHRTAFVRQDYRCLYWISRSRFDSD